MREGGRGEGGREEGGREEGREGSWCTNKSCPFQYNHSDSDFYYV